MQSALFGPAETPLASLSLSPGTRFVRERPAPAPCRTCGICRALSREPRGPSDKPIPPAVPERAFVGRRALAGRALLRQAPVRPELARREKEPRVAPRTTAEGIVGV